MIRDQISKTVTHHNLGRRHAAVLIGWGICAGLLMTNARWLATPPFDASLRQFVPPAIGLMLFFVASMILMAGMFLDSQRSKPDQLIDRLVEASPLLTGTALCIGVLVAHDGSMNRIFWVDGFIVALALPVFFSIIVSKRRVVHRGA